MFPDGAVFSYTHLFRLPEHYTSEKVWVICEQAGFDLRQGLMHPRSKDKKSKEVGESSGTDWGKGTMP